jgi:anti-sigma regulatory factor (Ser/Thr protein kinase)
VADPRPRSVVLNIGGTLQDLASLYLWLDDAAKPDHLPASLLNQLHVALEEAAVNVAMHGELPDGDDKIRIEYLSDTKAVTLIIEDGGQAFDPVEAATVTTADIGGKGLILLRHYCKDIAYSRTAGRNRLTMRFPRG